MQPWVKMRRGCHAPTKTGYCAIVLGIWGAWWRCWRCGMPTLVVLTGKVLHGHSYSQALMVPAKTCPQRRLHHVDMPLMSGRGEMMAPRHLLMSLTIHPHAQVISRQG